MDDHLSGLIAAPPTAMDAHGELNLGVVERQVRALSEAGVRGAFVCGTTGESMSLTVEERLRVAERWAEAAPAGFAVIVHVGHTALPAARALAEHAAAIGARAMAAMGPCFFRPSGADELAGFCARVAGAAPELPFYYYHIPSMTGVYLPMAEFLDAAAGRVPNLAGMKFTHEDLMDYCRCLRLEGGRYDMLFGRDEMLLSALALGATGAVGTTYNFAAPLYLGILGAYQRGDVETARAGQHRAACMVAVMRRFGGLRAAKAMMGLVGVDCGPVRAPLTPVEGPELDELRRALEDVGFFDYCTGADSHG